MRRQVCQPLDVEVDEDAPKAVVVHFPVVIFSNSEQELITEKGMLLPQRVTIHSIVLTSHAPAEAEQRYFTVVEFRLALRWVDLCLIRKHDYRRSLIRASLIMADYSRRLRASRSPKLSARSLCLISVRLGIKLN